MKNNFCLSVCALFCAFTLVSHTGTAQKAAKPAKLVQKWETKGFELPESVLYNKQTKALYVANINGKPDEADGNGYISKLTTGGKIESLKWATGLDAPKGMAASKKELYVSDITSLAIIDLESGKLNKKIPFEGAVFLNDVTIDLEGNVYVSDMKTNKVHKYDPKTGKERVWLEGPDLAGPNGLFSFDKTILVLNSESGILNSYNLAGEKTGTLAKGIKGGDGIDEISAGKYVASNWNGEVYLIEKGDAKKVLDTKDKKLNCADLCYDRELKLILVPTFFGNTVAAYAIEK